MNKFTQIQNQKIISLVEEVKKSTLEGYYKFGADIQKSLNKTYHLINLFIEELKVKLSKTNDAFKLLNDLFDKTNDDGILMINENNYKFKILYVILTKYQKNLL